MGMQMKNPGALAGATGAVFKAANFAKPNTVAELEATKDRHQRACDTLGYALALDNPEAWCSLSTVAFARLSEEEIAMAAYAFLRPLPKRLRQRICEAAMWGSPREA